MQEQAFDAAIDMICFTREDAESSLRAFRGVSHLVYCSTADTYGIQRDWLPVTEDHPLRPTTDYARNKAEADAAFLSAYYSEAFPVTIIKPATTYGPKLGLLRQISWDFTWIDRVRKGKPIIVCGDGNAIHQFLHVDDAALCFANVLGKAHCIGQIYNMVNRGFITWADYHRLAMKVLGREVDLVGVPLQDLVAIGVPGSDILIEDFAHHSYFSAEKLFRDVPEFRPVVSLEAGMRQVLESMDREGRVPDSDQVDWEDRIIAAQRTVRNVRFV
jgi:nucleoside-diphosphate-sugar epimerase